METPTEVGVEDVGGGLNARVWTEFVYQNEDGESYSIWWNSEHDRPAYASEMVPLSRMREPGAFFRQMTKARLS